MNQVELCLSKMARDLLARGIFTSTTDLARSIIDRYIDRYNRAAKPVRWAYRDLRGASLRSSRATDTVDVYGPDWPIPFFS